MSYNLIGLLVYMVIILVMGFVLYNRNKSQHCFIIGGPALNPWMVICSERASGE